MLKAPLLVLPSVLWTHLHHLSLPASVNTNCPLPVKLSSCICQHKLSFTSQTLFLHLSTQTVLYQSNSLPASVNTNCPLPVKLSSCICQHKLSFTSQSLPVNTNCPLPVKLFLHLSTQTVLYQSTSVPVLVMRERVECRRACWMHVPEYFQVCAWVLNAWVYFFLPVCQIHSLHYQPECDTGSQQQQASWIPFTFCLSEHRPSTHTLPRSLKPWQYHWQNSHFALPAPVLHSACSSDSRRPLARAAGSFPTLWCRVVSLISGFLPLLCPLGSCFLQPLLFLECSLLLCCLAPTKERGHQCNTWPFSMTQCQTDFLK